MAAAAPRLVDYQEFKDYQGQKLEFDRKMISVKRVIEQLIEKKDTPEHITDELFKRLCLISSTKNTMYHKAVNNYYESIKNTDNKVSFVSLGKNINLFLQNINIYIENAKDSIIDANKATKDQLEGYNEYIICIGIVRDLFDLLNKIQDRIREIDNKEKAVRAEAAKRREAAEAVAVKAVEKADFMAGEAESKWLDFLKNIPHVVSRSGQTNEKDEFKFDFNGIPSIPSIPEFVIKSLNMQIVNPLGADFYIFKGKKYRYIVKKFDSEKKLFYFLL